MVLKEPAKITCLKDHRQKKMPSCSNWTSPICRRRCVHRRAPLFLGLPYVEGAWMSKHNEKYYLQYGTPGSRFNIYGDGVYVSDAPLGTFKLAASNPFSYKPGGFIPGAGHGSTMEDRHDNLWHTATMRICVNHNFERRIGLWPAGWDADGEMFCNQRFGDWPQRICEGKIDPWADPEWMLLSYNKNVRASSSADDHPAEKCG